MKRVYLQRFCAIILVTTLLCLTVFQNTVYYATDESGQSLIDFDGYLIRELDEID